MGKLFGPALAALAVLAGCGVVLGIEDTTDDHSKDLTNPSPDEDRGEGVLIPDDAGLDENGNVTFADDGGVDDGGDPAPDAGTACNPTSAFVPASGATGTVCNPENVLAGTGGAAGLDYTFGDLGGHIDGRVVTSCVGAQFDKTLLTFVVRASFTAKACVTACTGATCGTLKAALVFAGLNGNLKYVTTLALGSAYAGFTVVPPPALAANQVVVCRGNGGGGRDDVAVDSIVGKCQ